MISFINLGAGQDVLAFNRQPVNNILLNPDRDHCMCEESNRSTIEIRLMLFSAFTFSGGLFFVIGTFYFGYLHSAVISIIIVLLI